MKHLTTLLLLVLGLATVGFSQGVPPPDAKVLNVRCDSLLRRHNQGEKPILRARSQVNIACTLKDKTRTKATAGHRVVLRDGFHAKEGSKFHAYISFRGTGKTELTDLMNEEKPYVVYPNPTTNILYIATDFNTEIPVTVSVVDLVGKILYTTQQPDQQLLEYQFDAALPKGLYFVRLQAGEQVWVEKILYQ